MDNPLWRPDAERAARAQITLFARAFGLEGPDAVERLRQRSVEDPATFWRAVW